MAHSLFQKIKQNARSAQSNANATLGLLIQSIDVYGESGDWTNIAWIISLAQTSDKTRLSAIAQAASGITFVKDEKQPTGLRIKDKGSEVNRMDDLRAYYKGEYSFRAKALEDYEGRDCALAPLLVGKVAKLRTVEEVMLAAVRKSKADNGEQATKARLLAAFGAALSAEFPE